MQLHACIAERLEHLESIEQIAREAVEPVDHDLVNLSSLDQLVQPLKRGAVGVGSRFAHVVKPFADPFPARLALRHDERVAKFELNIT